MIAQGKRPLIIKTANSIPQMRNHRRALADMVFNTSAFTTALSILEITSNTIRPTIVNMDVINMGVIIQ
jgi:hypothetical protein